MPTHTVRWWFNRRHEIDISPAYQRRGKLWSRTDQGYLIDSIINGFDMPKLYMADFTFGDSPLNKKKLTYAIIDGKQRLEAIFDFFLGEVTLNDDFVLLDEPSLSVGGLGFKDLQAGFPQIAERFEEYELGIMAVITREEERVNDLLNRSKPLTGAEVRNAMKGPVPELIRQVAQHEFFTSNIRFSIQRGDDLNLAAKVLSFEYFEKLQSTKKADLDEFVRKPSKNKEKLELASWNALDTFERLADIFLPSDRLLASAGLVPVYYWFIKNRTELEYRFIRQFIQEFEKERASNRELIRTDPESSKIDQQLSEYDQYNRSTNDLRSHVERVRILNERFDGMLKARYGTVKIKFGKAKQ